MAELVAHTFPPNFPLDTDVFALALAEHNLSAGTTLTFLQLDSAARSSVLARAEALKKEHGKPLPAIVPPELSPKQTSSDFWSRFFRAGILR